MYKITIIVISDIVLYSQHFLDIMVKRIRRIKSPYLAVNIAETEALFTKRINRSFSKFDDAFIIEFAIQICFDNFVIDILKKLLKVEQQNITIITMLSEMFMEIARHAPESKIITFFLDRRTIIVNERAGNNRNKSIFAKNIVYHSVSKTHTHNMTQYASFSCVKLIVFDHLIFFVPYSIRIGIDIYWSKRNIELNAFLFG